MKTIIEPEFLRWAESVGLGLDSRYPDAHILTFSAQAPQYRYWRLPSKCYGRPYFLGCMLELLGDWTTCYAWRHQGYWPQTSEIDEDSGIELVEHEIYKGLGIPFGTSDILVFTRDEYAALLTMMFCASQFGWSVGQDLHIVPDHARQFMMISHQDEVWVQFRKEEDIAAWAELMEGRNQGRPHCHRTE